MLAFIDFVYQNRFINEYARKKKKLKSQSPRFFLIFFLVFIEKLMFLIILGDASSVCKWSRYRGETSQKEKENGSECTGILIIYVCRSIREL